MKGCNWEEEGEGERKVSGDQWKRRQQQRKGLHYKQDGRGKRNRKGNYTRRIARARRRRRRLRLQKICERASLIKPPSPRLGPRVPTSTQGLGERPNKVWRCQHWKLPLHSWTISAVWIWKWNLSNHGCVLYFGSPGPGPTNWQFRHQQHQIF